MFIYVYVYIYIYICVCVCFLFSVWPCLQTLAVKRSFEIAFEIAGAIYEKSVGEFVLDSWTGLKIIRGRFGAFFELFVLLFVLELGKAFSGQFRSAEVPRQFFPLHQIELRSKRPPKRPGTPKTSK